MPRLLEQYVSGLPALEELFPVPAELISQRENATDFPDASCASPHDQEETESFGAALWEACAGVTTAR
ncbi:hypothetical protein [Prosthecobacter fluviatilis]|uniref:Uncharacterized protein n=1 Tax=Prosthecobacter fluviatilis TaxID=445931 RepID=A0ABW0KVB6_9BACT